MDQSPDFAVRPARLLLFVLVTWAVWQLVFGPGTERNTFGLIAPLTGWGLIAAFQQKRGRWLMGLSFFLTMIALSGDIERRLSPHTAWVLLAHPIGIILFYAWFLRWHAQEQSGFWRARLAL